VELFIVSLIVSQAEAAAAAGESSFKSFMVAVQRCGSSVAIVQQVCWVTFLVISSFQKTISEKASPTKLLKYSNSLIQSSNHLIFSSSILQILYLVFSYQWMVHMLPHVKKCQLPCPKLRQLLIKDFSSALKL